MTTDFQQGLLIAAIGMGLVFAVIILLWWLMALLMRLTSREKSEEIVETNAAEDKPVVIPAMAPDERKFKAVAAAIAVAIALEKPKMQPGMDQVGDVKGNLSPWLTVHRSRQLDNRR
jgi:sodium pump decarboxylase gamma subunit